MLQERARELPENVESHIQVLDTLTVWVWGRSWDSAFYQILYAGGLQILLAEIAFLELMGLETDSRQGLGSFPGEIPVSEALYVETNLSVFKDSQSLCCLAPLLLYIFPLILSDFFFCFQTIHIYY